MIVIGLVGMPRSPSATTASSPSWTGSSVPWTPRSIPPASDALCATPILTESLFSTLKMLQIASTATKGIDIFNILARIYVKLSIGIRLRNVIAAMKL